MERTLGGDRPARPGIVLDRLTESDPEGEDQDDQEHADAPPDRLLTSTQPSALVALHGGEGAHGV